MTIIEKLNGLKINMRNIAEYIWISQGALVNKVTYWYKISDEHKKKLSEYLDMKIRELIKIKLLVDKELKW